MDLVHISADCLRCSKAYDSLAVQVKADVIVGMGDSGLGFKIPCPALTLE